MQILTDSQQVTAQATFTSRRQNPAPVENVVWGTSDASILSVEPDAADPLKAVIKAVGPVGTAQVSCQADGHIGDGEALVVLTADVQVVAGDAVQGTVSFGAAEEQA